MGGLFGIASTQDCVKDLFYGTDYHSHLGTKRAGMAVVNKKGFTRSIHNIENAYFRSKFEPELQDFRGTSGIGVISDFDAQPLIINSHLGTFAIVTVGRINNIEALGRTAFARKKYFSETSGSGINPTELISMLVCEEKSFKDGISSVFRSIKGSCTLMILTKKGIIAARDRLGRTPLAIGRKNGSLAVTSETCALSNLGYEAEYYLGPGEIVHITADGFEQLAPAGSEMQVCSFLWVYYGYPPSNYENINVEMVRYRCGRALARNDTVEADLVSGIPDSGIGHAVGYANEKHIPYMRPYTKYTPTWPRSFMPQSQAVRDLVAKMKLIPNRSVIENNRIVFCDDSIVRGTQLKDNVRILFDYGAREVHMRVACPTLIYPCEFLNFSSSRSSLDLAGRKAIYELEGTNHVSLEEYARAGSEKNLAMVEKIRQRLGLTSLKFQTMDDLVEAIGLPKEKLCTHCWDGSSRC
ncbi:MAG: Amidophosphoribosyltransferase precursor [Deltaproteobacteria bacterium ADurb.BinA179]|jgi:amidophosphoribosyltransferase|nr:MAG: Amidophosphoribosyltransferase precursor [Deltaproteobacteria bacterium ADurb.BinA179]HNU75930.1 amidophosphoribosyltransferase [Deltaproteobacteria bacterium]HRR20547.1 amidophosphoribosyltransferase [Desulfomonilia bacterium]HOD70598.1 amidophosphoribosyltransferase [Deltaproteobacteria bacterium]HQM20629.1 amidophosphoribosyltransferase [Deltaproteobacteria bacterium]